MLDVQDFLCAVSYCMGKDARIDKTQLIEALHQLYETDPREYADFMKHRFYGTNDYVTEALLHLKSCGYLKTVWDGQDSYYEVSEWLGGNEGKAYYDRLIAGQRKTAKSVAIMLVGKNMMKSTAKTITTTNANNRRTKK